MWLRSEERGIGRESNRAKVQNNRTQRNANGDKRNKHFLASDDLLKFVPVSPPDCGASSQNLAKAM